MSVTEISTVADLAEIAEAVGHSSFTVPVSDVSVANGEIHVSGREALEADDVAVAKLAKLFGMPVSYLVKGDEETRAWNLNHRFEGEDGEISFFTVGSTVIGVSDPNKQSLPVSAYLSGIVKNFDGGDRVVEFHNDPEYLHIDIVAGEEIEVAGFGTEARPSVGDITRAGVRVIATPDLAKAPVVSTYLYRLVCSNGMSIAEPEHKINLRGKTTEEINDEFKAIIGDLKLSFGSRLQGYADTANIPIVGERSHFLYQVGHERGLAPRVITRVLDLGSNLPEDASVYDALNVFSAVGNESVSYRSRLALQGIGGYLAGDTARAMERCANCLHPFISDWDRV